MKRFVKKWLEDNFDDLDQCISPTLTFEDVMRKPSLANSGSESVTRERIFGELSDCTGLPYDVFYYAWLDETSLEGGCKIAWERGYITEKVYNETMPKLAKFS